MNYPRYEVFKDTRNEYRFNLVTDGNYKVILTASEGYSYKSDCLRAVEICQINSPNYKNFDSRSTSNGKYYFTLRSDNYKDIGRSEDYDSAYSRDQGIEVVKRDGKTKNVFDRS